jgi:hypothetical protein
MDGSVFAITKTNEGLWFTYGVSLTEIGCSAIKSFEPEDSNIQIIEGKTPIIIYYETSDDLAKMVSKAYFDECLSNINSLNADRLGHEIVPKWFSFLSKYHLLRKCEDNTNVFNGALIIGIDDKIFYVGADGQSEEIYHYCISNEEADLEGDKLYKTIERDQLSEMIKNHHRFPIDKQWFHLPTVSGYLSAKSFIYEGLNGEKRQIKGGDFEWH